MGCWVILLELAWKLQEQEEKKLHFTRGCSIFAIKKRKRDLTPDSFFFFSFFQWFWHFVKYFNSNYNLPSYKLFLKCFGGFFYLGVHRVAGVFFVFFFGLLLSRSLRACLRITEKRWKIGPVLQIQAFSMKLWVRGFLFLVFHHIKTDDKNKFFSITTSTLRKGGFFSELFESKSCGKCCLIIIRVEKIQLCWPFPWGCKLMITKLKLLTTLHWTTVFSLFHVNWRSTEGKYHLLCYVCLSILFLLK